MILRIFLTFILAGAVLAQPTRSSANNVVAQSEVAIPQGRMADVLALTPECVLNIRAKAAGTVPTPRLAARKGETTVIKLLASDGMYQFERDPTSARVRKSATGRSFAIDTVPYQLGDLMPKMRTKMFVIEAPAGWSTASNASTAERAEFFRCFADLATADLAGVRL